MRHPARGTITVWGCGGVGQMAIRIAFLVGAGRVIAVGRFPGQLEMAQEKAGAETINYTQVDSVIETLKEMTGGRGSDACIDTVGMEAHGTGIDYACDRVKQALRLGTDRGAALRQAIAACRKGGVVSALGVYGIMDKFPIGVLMKKGLGAAQRPAARPEAPATFAGTCLAGRFGPLLSGDTPVLAGGCAVWV